MGFSRFAVPQQGTIVRSGEEIATLVRRTYTLVFASILVTIAGAAYAMTNAQMMEAVLAHRWIMLACVFVPLILAQVSRNSFPQNIGFVFLFTFAEGLYVAPFIAMAEAHSPGIASQAGLLTFTAFGTLTMYAFLTRRDFSAWGSFLVTGLVVLLVTMALLVFDTWRMRNVYGPDDYVMAAVHIYLDLLNMFLFILSLLSGNRKN